MNDDSKERLRTRLRHATEEAILHAAEEVMAELGVEGAGMQAIAQRAGASVGTLYNYFVNRDGLIRGLLLARREELWGRFEAAPSEPGDGFEARLGRLLRAILEHFEAHRRFLSIAVESERVRTLIRAHEDEPSTRPVMVQLADRARPLVAEAVAAGELRAEDAEAYPALLAGLVRSLALQRLREPAAVLTDDVDRLVRFFMDGASSRWAG